MLHGHMADFMIAVQYHASSVTGTWAIGGATCQTDEYCVRNLAGGVMSAQFFVSPLHGCYCLPLVRNIT